MGRMTDYIVYTMANDTVLMFLATFLQKHTEYHRGPLKVIPFDENIELTRELCDLYGVEMVTPDEKWDRLGRALYRDEEYREGVKSWRYFRKFNVFNGRREDFIFLDVNTLPLSPLDVCVDLKRECELDILFASRSQQGKNFKPWAKKVLNMINPELKNGFGAGFFVAGSDLFNDVDFIDLTRFHGIRQMFMIAPEQSFLSFLVTVKQKRVKKINDLTKDFTAVARTRNNDLLDFEEYRAHGTIAGKKTLIIKWAGYYINQKKKIPYCEFLRELFPAVRSRVEGHGALEEALERDFRCYTRWEKGEQSL